MKVESPDPGQVHSFLLPAEKLQEYFSRRDTVTRWWRPEEGPYRHFYARQLRVLDGLLPVREGMRVLDLGTGQGRFARYFARKGCKVTAIDINEEMLELARHKARAEGLEGAIDFQCCAVEKIHRLVPGPFHIVSCMELLDHLADPAGVIQAAVGQMVGGGRLVFSFCTADALQGRILRMAQRLFSHPALHLARSYDAREIAGMIEYAELRLDHIVGLGLVNFVLRESASRFASQALGMLGALEGLFVPYYTAPRLTPYCTHNIGIAHRP